MDQKENVFLLSEQGDGNTPKAPGLGRRHLVTLLCFLGMGVSYSLRFNLSVALVAMVNSTQTASSTNFTGHDTCPPQEESTTSTQRGEFDWDASTQGLVLSSFFYGYITTQLFGGLAAQRYGGKAVFGVGMGVTAFLSVLSPVLARTHVSLLIAALVLEGVASGVTLPAMYIVLSKWSPSSEKTFFGSVALSGNNVGTVVATAISGVLAQYAPDGGWPYIFYVFGGLGMLWFVAWMFLTTESPSDHPSISEEEKAYILHTTGNREKSPKTPWKAILTSLPVWGTIVGHTTRNWVYYTLLTTLPSYLEQVLNFNMSQNGLVTALPFLVMSSVEIVGSLLVDYIRSRGILTTTTVRRICTGLGLFLPSIFLVIQSYIGCDLVASVVMLCLATGFMGFASSGVFVSYYDIAPLHVGTIMGIGNTFATVPGMVSPSITEAITAASPFISRWRTVFFISLAISLVGGIFYLFTCSGDEQSWAKDNYEEIEDSSLGTSEKTSEKRGIHLSRL